MRLGEMYNFKWLSGNKDNKSSCGRWYRRTGCRQYHVIDMTKPEPKTYSMKLYLIDMNGYTETDINKLTPLKTDIEELDLLDNSIDHDYGQTILEVDGPCADTLIKYVAKPYSRFGLFEPVSGITIVKKL